MLIAEVPLIWSLPNIDFEKGDIYVLLKPSRNAPPFTKNFVSCNPGVDGLVPVALQ